MRAPSTGRVRRAGRPRVRVEPAHQPIPGVVSATAGVGGVTVTVDSPA